MQSEIRQMVESILRELVHTIRAEPVRPPKVLYIFCDSTAHEAFTDHFIRLKKEGICHDILFLDGESSSWLGKHKIECGGPGKLIAVDEYAPAPLELPLEYDGIVIPELDLDNAARAAQGLKGTVKSEILFAAMVLGKFVLIGEDAPGLKRADRRTLMTLDLPKPYTELFEKYKRELSALGAEFAPQKQLAEVVVRRVHSKSFSKLKEESAAEEDVLALETDTNLRAALVPENDFFMLQEPRTADMGNSGNDTIFFGGRLVSAAWVQQQLTGRSVRQLAVSKGTIVSPLARDVLKQAGVSVQYTEDEG